MSDAKHTPGPWVVEDERYHGPNWAIIGSADTAGWHAFVRVAVQLDNKPSDEGEANARLIAAAPDLLAALQFVMSAHGEQLHDAFDDAHKAIAKATGQQ